MIALDQEAVAAQPASAAEQSPAGRA